jgi:hypothetical protein
MPKSPYGAVPQIATSGAVAAAIAAATLPAVPDQYTWLSGFDIDGGGATAASLVVVTVTGLQGGTITFTLGVPAGATLPVSLEKRFPDWLRSSGKNIGITVSAASFGVGNTRAVTNVYGFATSE